MTPKPELTSMTVSLPAAQKDWVRAQAVASGCSTPSEYIRRLIHADQVAKEQATAKLEALILEGLKSPTELMTRERWESLCSDLARQLEKRRLGH